MIDYEEILNKKVVGVLATVSEDGPQTRAFQALWAETGKVYFCTGAQKPVYKQLTGTPKASFCIENKFSPVMSFNGDVVFEENLEYKERAFQILPMLKKMYQEPTNPLFKVFHINIKKIRTFSYAEGPKEYSLE
ncbi:MAG: pyridoxamine 5'-phosphate oxidase family protein [Selenomonas sp.]|nr:pyridoxamine 5'-phosphate oxidase family protein [Selenomonas sp.]MDY6296447.1 pyridoxamine 5'-phosphate oxidase family protein [Schwartzia succinivorans]